MLDSVILCFDPANGKDIPVLTVGKKKDGEIEIINIFTGQEAKELFERVTTKSDSFIRALRGLSTPV